MRRRGAPGLRRFTAVELVEAVEVRGLHHEPPDVLADFLAGIGYDPLLYVRARRHLRLSAAGLPLRGYVWDRPDLPLRRLP